MDKKTDKKIDLIFSEDPGKLLIDVKSHLEKENLHPISLNVVKEHNNFCAIVTSKQKDEFIG